VQVYADAVSSNTGDLKEGDPGPALPWQAPLRRAARLAGGHSDQHPERPVAALEEVGLVEKVPYQLRPPRYEYQLTAKGMDLLPVLRALAEGSLRPVPAPGAPSPELLEA